MKYLFYGFAVSRQLSGIWEDEVDVESVNEKLQQHSTEYRVLSVEGGISMRNSYLILVNGRVSQQDLPDWAMYLNAMWRHTKSGMVYRSQDQGNDPAQICPTRIHVCPFLHNRNSTMTGTKTCTSFYFRYLSYLDNPGGIHQREQRGTDWLVLFCPRW